MDTIFMNSENSRTSEYHVLVLKLTNKLHLKRGQKSVAAHTITMSLKYRLPHGVISLTCLMGAILLLFCCLLF